MTSNVSVVTLAQLSQGVYVGQSSNIPAGYTLQPLLTQTVGAMTAQTFVSSDKNNVIVVFTGTDANAANYSQQKLLDREIVAGNGEGNANATAVESQLSAATTYVQQTVLPDMPNIANSDAVIALTGHSLGATFADSAQIGLQQSDINNGTNLAANISTVGFDPAALPSSLVPSGLTVNAVNIASYADPAIAVTQYLGNVVPGQTTYVDTGTSPDGIIQGLVSGTLQTGSGLFKAIMGYVTDNATQVVNGTISVVQGGNTYAGAVNTALNQGHSIGLLAQALQSQQTASGTTLTAAQVKGNSALTPLLTQIQGSTIVATQLSIANALNQWALQRGFGANNPGLTQIKSLLSAQSPTSATTAQTTDVISVMLNNGDIYSLNSSGNVSTLTSSQDPNGNIDLAISNADGSTQQAVANSSGQISTITSQTTDTVGNGDIVDVQSFGSGNSLSYEQITTTPTSGQVSVEIDGQGDVANLSNAAITQDSGSSATIDGNDDAIGLTVNSSSSVTVSGTGDVVTPGQNVANGTQDAVTFAGDGTSVMVKGSNVAIDLANDDQTVTTGGMSTGDQIAAVSGATGDAIDAANATISAGGAFSGSVSGNDDRVMLVVNTSSSVTVSGTGDVVAGRMNVDDGTQNDVTLAGDGTSAMVNGAGVDVTLAADDQTLSLGVNSTGDQIAAASGVTDDTLAGSNATITAGSGFAGNLDGSNDTATMANGDYIGVAAGTGETINQSSGQVVMDADTSANINGADNTISTAGAVAINLDGDGNAATMGAGSYVGVVSGTGETINESSGQVVMLANETANVNGAGDAISAGAGTQINITGSDNTATMANGDYVGIISGQGDVVDLSGGSMRTLDNITADLNGSNDTTYLGNSVSETVSGSNDTAYLPNNGDSTIDFSGSGFVGSNGNRVDLAGSGTDVTVNGESDRIDLTGSNETVDALGGDAIYVGNNVSGMTIYATDSAIYEGSNDSINIEGSGDGIDGSDSDYTDYDGSYFDDYDGGSGSYGGGSFGGGSSGGSSGGPVVLDVAGKGIKITPLTSSNTFFDMGGDGYEHHTAWAGVGNAVLVLDLAGNGQITQANQVNFTDWDPTAKTDMQALEDVFDTNHDGKLDAGDADFADFKIMVTNADGTQTLETLAQAGIVSINLTPDKTSQTFSDGSSIDGETTFTKTDGSTGAAATVSFAYGAYAYVVNTTTVRNPDGSTTIDNRAFNPDGKLASDTISTTSADGLSKATSFDSDGDGVVDRIQTDVTHVDADGSKTETLTDKTSASVLLNQTITTTSADGATVSIQRDTNGDGITDETEVDSTNPDGSKSVTATDLNLDGSVRSQTITTTSADGLTSTVRTDSNGDGIFDLTKVDATVINADGSSTDTITDTNADGSLHDKTVTTTSADGSSKTVETDSNGDGVFDLTQVSTIVANAGGGTTTTQIDQNADGSKRDETDTTISSDGLSKTTKLDTNGDGVVDLITADVTVLNADGSRTETVTDTNGDGALTSQVVTIRGADGVSRTTEVDSTGNGKFNHTENIAKNASGATVDTVSDFNADGSLKDQFITTTSADGLTQTTQSNLGGSAGAPAESVQEQSFTTNKVDAVETQGAASSDVTDIQTLPDSAFASDGPILNTHGNGVAGSDFGLNQLVQAMAGFNAQPATTTSAALPVEAMTAAQSLAVSRQSH